MKTKLKLKDLKVTSFVTALESNETLTVKGGAQTADVQSEICTPNIRLSYLKKYCGDGGIN